MGTGTGRGRGKGQGQGQGHGEVAGFVGPDFDPRTHLRRLQAAPASVGWSECPAMPVEPRMEGELWRRSDDVARKWRKRWFELDPDQGLAYWDTKVRGRPTRPRA